MSRLKRHQHVFQTVEGELVTSTLIPFGDRSEECITLTSLHFLIGVPPAQALAMLKIYKIERKRRQGQEWVAVSELMRVYDLRSCS